MKRLFIILVAAVALGWAMPQPAQASWTLVQHPRGTCNVTPCSLTVAATGAGNVGFIILLDGNGSTDTLLSVSDGSSAWIVNSSCRIANNSIGNIGAAYTLSLAGGITSITSTFTANTFNGEVEFLEYSSALSPLVFDSCGGHSNGSSASPSGQALTLTGTSDVILQVIDSGGPQNATAITGAYTSPADFPFSGPSQGGYGIAGAINTSSGAAPTWTLNGANITIVLAIAIKETPLAAPLITSGNSTTFTLGINGTFTVTATGNPTPTFSKTGSLPSAVTLSAGGVLSGVPGAGTAGTYPITITATNGVNPDATQSFTLTVVVAAYLTGQIFSAPMFPQATPSVAFPPDAGYTHTAVASGANLQTAITGAACGTKLLLAANGSFTAGGTAYTMPNTACACHTDPSKYVIIQSDDPSYTNGSVRGTRIDPSVEYTKLAHITGTDNAGTFAAVTNGDSCYRLGPGLDITNTTGTFEIINIGSQQPTPANFPHDIILDHILLRAGAAANMQHCAEMSGNFMAVVDSYISDCHYVGSDAQAIFVRDGYGAHLWQNNFLEGATENTMSGAVAAQVTPSDFTIQGNHYFKSLAWRRGDPSYYGILYPVKNSLEVKLGQRILVTGNVFEYTWANGQNEFVVLNQGCNAHMGVGNLIQDINFNLNIFRHGPSTFIYGGCDDSVAYPTLRVYLHDNLWWDIDALLWDGPGAAEKTVLINPGGFGAPRPPFSAWDLWHVHETYSAANMGTGVYFSNGPSFYYGIQIRDSILGCGDFGCFYGTSSTTGDSTVSTSAPTANFKNNCLYGTLNTPYNSSNFTGLQNPANLAAIFVNPGSDFHVKPSSLCYQTASDGKSMGADIDAVNAATAGAVQTLGNLHTVTNVSPSTFTHLGSTSITITGTNFISGAAEVIIGGAGPSVAETSNSCGFGSPGQFTVTVSTDTTHFTYTGGCAVVTSAPITLAVNDTINVTVNSAATTGAVNRYTPGNLCTSLSVVNATTITCVTPAATGTVTNGPVSVFVSQFGIQAQFNGANYN